MEKFVSLETYSINEAAGSSGYHLSKKDAESLIAAVLGFIDTQVNQLKSEILSGKYATKKRGTFDRLKNWWYNTIMGQQNQKNPYYKTNLLGSLGQVSEMKLEDYNFLLSEARKIESIAEQKTNLDTILNNWASEFKRQIESRLKEFLRNRFVQQPIRKVTKKVKKTLKPINNEKRLEAEKEVIETAPKPSTNKQHKLIEILNKIKAKEESDIFLGSVLEDREAVLVVDILANRDAFKKDEKAMDDLIQTLDAYIQNKPKRTEQQNLHDLDTIEAKFLKNNLKDHVVELELRKSNYDKKEKLDFKNTTLYERTIECLDKLRIIKH